MRPLPPAILLLALGVSACGDSLDDPASSDDDAVGDTDGSPGSDDVDAGAGAIGEDGGETDPPYPVMTPGVMATECGDGDVTAGAPIARAPYLQQVTPSSAIVGWTSTDTVEQRIVITTPDGAPVATAMSAIENTIVPSGVHQRWATISGLAPGTVYCYAVASASVTLTARAGFRTAPAPDSDATVRFVALGDSGTGGPDQRAVLEQIRQVPQDLIIHVGDIAYSSGTIDELETRNFDVYAPLLRFVPLFVVAGDHEHVTSEAAPFRAVFNLPNNERWYSFDWGSVHFAALDTDEDLATQAAWLDADLAATDRPWKVVYFHEPPYSSGEHGSTLYVRAAFAPILEEHGVHLVFSGDDHDYERTTPINGVTYIVTGGGGAGLRSVGESDFTAYIESVHHFVQVEASPDALTLHAIDKTGDEIDSVVIPRE